MADSLGIKSKFAFKKDRGLYGAGPAIAYPEVPGGASLGATHMIPASGESMGLGKERIKDPALVGSGIQTPSVVSKEKSAGSVEGRLRYEGWARLILCAMGFESAITPASPGGSPANLGSGGYGHVFELDEDMQDEGWAAGERTGGSANDRKVRRGMLGEYKQVTGTPDWVWNSVMVDKMTVSGSPSGVDISFDLVGYDVYRGTYNSTNWTLPTAVGGASQALFTSLSVSLGTRAAGLGGLVNQAINSFEITLANNLVSDDQTASTGVNIVQPMRSSFREVMLKFEYPRYSADTNFTNFDTDVEMIAGLVFTGPLIGGAIYHRIGFFFDSLRHTEQANPIEGPGPIKESLTFQAHRLGSATSIFSTVYWPNVTTLKDCEMRCLIQNTVSTNYLNEN